MNDFLKFNGQHSMQDISNFAMGSLEIWIAVLIFRIKTGGGGGGGNVSWKI